MLSTEKLTHPTKIAQTIIHIRRLFVQEVFTRWERVVGAFVREFRLAGPEKLLVFVVVWVAALLGILNLLQYGLNR